MIGIGKNIFKANVKAGGGAVVYDADAQAFFTAANITDSTQKNAVNTLVISLKSANIWTKMKALYPIVGGVESSHAVNLKTPGTYNLTFQTGWTHASTGMTPSNAYANTNLISSISGLFQNSTHISYYSRTNNNFINDACMGAQYLTGDAGLTQMTIRDSDNIFFCRINDTSIPVSIPNTNGTGFYIASRTTSTTIATFRNTTKTSVSQTSAGLPVRVMEIGRILINGVSYYGGKQCAFASIGDGLTDAEASSFYTAVQTYQTTLGRQV